MTPPICTASPPNSLLIRPVVVDRVAYGCAHLWRLKGRVREKVHGQVVVEQALPVTTLYPDFFSAVTSDGRTLVTASRSPPFKRLTACGSDWTYWMTPN